MARIEFDPATGSWRPVDDGLPQPNDTESREDPDARSVIVDVPEPWVDSAESIDRYFALVQRRHPLIPDPDAPPNTGQLKEDPDHWIVIEPDGSITTEESAP